MTKFGLKEYRQKWYRLTGVDGISRRTPFLDADLPDDAAALAWVKQLCLEQRSFKPSKLVEMIQRGDIQRNISLASI